MGRKGFSTAFDPETTACARGVDMPCSPKASRNIARAIKGMKVTKAKEFLQQVVEKKTPVPVTVRFRKIKHRRGTGFGPGNYPVKAAGKVLGILENAENNAEYKGLETEDLRIIHASAYVGLVLPGYMPRAQGRATAKFEETTNVELVIGKDERLDALDEAKAERGGSRKGKKPTKAAEPSAPAATEAAEPGKTSNADKETVSKPAPKAAAKPADKPAAPAKKAPAKAADKPAAPAKKAATAEKKTKDPEA